MTLPTAIGLYYITRTNGRSLCHLPEYIYFIMKMCVRDNVRLIAQIINLNLPISYLWKKITNLWNKDFIFSINLSNGSYTVQHFSTDLTIINFTSAVSNVYGSWL